MTHGLLQLLERSLLESLNLQSIMALYALVVSICLYFQWQRIRLLKEQNAFSETKRTAAQEDLKRAMEFGSSASHKAPFPDQMSGKVFDILLIDDEEAILAHRALIEEHLPGSRVRIARNAAEAWDEMQHKTPCLVITDIVMPVMNGYVLLEKLAMYYPWIPVIAVSAYVNSLEEILTKLGNNILDLTFLAKPFTVKRLIVAIRAASPKRTRFSRWLRRGVFRGRMLKIRGARQK
jgi:CheY-like chemotaxis protein